MIQVVTMGLHLLVNPHYWLSVVDSQIAGEAARVDHASSGVRQASEGFTG
jgi:hypothetical protein